MSMINSYLMTWLARYDIYSSKLCHPTLQYVLRTTAWTSASSVQILPDVTPSMGKLHLFCKKAVTFEPIVLEEGGGRG